MRSKVMTATVKLFRPPDFPLSGKKRGEKARVKKRGPGVRVQALAASVDTRGHVAPVAPMCFELPFLVGLVEG